MPNKQHRNTKSATDAEQQHRNKTSATYAERPRVPNVETKRRPQMSETLDVPSVAKQNKTQTSSRQNGHRCRTNNVAAHADARSMRPPSPFSPPFGNVKRYKGSLAPNTPSTFVPQDQQTRAPKRNAGTPSTCTTQGQTRGPPKSTRAPKVNAGPLQRLPHRVKHAGPQSQRG